MTLSWYLRRARAMSAAEFARRVADVGTQKLLERRLLARAAPATFRPGFLPTDPGDLLVGAPTSSTVAVVDAADAVIDGHWDVFGRRRGDLTDPDWSFDPWSQRSAPEGRAFAIKHREWPGSLKHVWELSRHHHLTCLASALAVTKDGRYADVIEQQLRSWWRANPPLMGVHWMSGIELGIRLISWVWIRRLLDPFGAVRQFEDDPEFRTQLWAHQEWLARLPSHGSSANNHLVAEAAGAFIAACAFPSKEADRWCSLAKARLEHEIVAQVGDDGVHRELSFGYHAFVTELFALAAVEGEISGHRLSERYWVTLARMFDAFAAAVDTSSVPPRQNDSDDAVALLLDHPEFDRWASVLSLGSAVVGAQDWWPSVHGDIRSSVVASIVRPRDVGGRPRVRPDVLGDAGQTFLREVWHGHPVWCRCDGGPHGFLRPAAHGHADALSLELRHGGVEVLVDPGTYSYQADPGWRDFFRSTRAHNTLEVEGESQAVVGGPFLWASRPNVTVHHVNTDGSQSWEASHDGYASRYSSLIHRRKVLMDGTSLRVEDRVTQPAAVSLRFHLGPTINCELDQSSARLQWTVDGLTVRAALELSPKLGWRIARGEQDPPLGWFSPSFDRKVPTITLEGTGVMSVDAPVVTLLTLDKGGQFE